MINKLNKYIWIGFFLAIFLIITIGALYYINLNSLKRFKNDDISFKYNKVWNVTKGNNIILTYQTDSKITIEVKNLNNEEKTKNMGEIKDIIKYDFQKNNSDYKLISESQNVISKNNYNGFQLLFEKDSKQCLITTFQNRDKIVSIVYQANNDQFDILLDNVLSIIWEFNILEGD
jgi:hypothetical protein